MKRSLSSLRGRVALVATGAVAAVLILVGIAAVTAFSDRESERIDRDLAARSAPALAGALAREEAPRGGPPPGGQFGPPALRPVGQYVRLTLDGDVVGELDAAADLPVADGPGLKTIEAGGSEYRVLTRELGPEYLVEIGQDLSDANARVADLRNQLLVIGLIGVLLVAALSWWLAGLTLRPLGRLREAAGRVTTTDDLSTRIEPGNSPSEVEELTESINEMLARLQGSASETRLALEATRRFAGDAGHELRTPMTALQANLGAVRRNPDLDSAERNAALEQMDRDAARMMRMLETLQTLARGDSSAVVPREELDFTSLLASAVESAHRRHPAVSWKLDLPDEQIELEGWADGLRALVDNLLENAGRHGRREGVVAVAASAQNGRIKLTVEDDGDGIAPEDRQRIFERFERGDFAGATGSGLGLSLVRQQAKLHGGEVSVGESDSGGARFTVELG